MDQIVPEAALPMRVTALSECFRSEAGAAGRDTRGMLRQHQFRKVELVSITHPEQSAEHVERAIRKLRAGLMPPPGRPRPDAATVKTFVAALESIDGATFRFAGANVAVIYGDEEREHMTQTLNEAARQGLRVVRVWAFGESGACEALGSVE